MGTNDHCPIVGIGASAGGLEALKQFLSAMPPDSGAAFVLIQHLDPHHESLTAEILARCTRMDVVQVEEPMQVEANRVYVIPPNTYLSLSGNALHLSAPVLQRGMRMPVDRFFRSLAEERGDRAIGVIVSGTGTDGTLGIKEIKGHGGLVIAQTPESAQYEGMPQSAIATGLVDVVRPVEGIPDVLCRYLQHAYIKEPDHPQALVAQSDDMRTILALLQTHTGYDFRAYKKGTLGRRIARRMGLRHIESLRQYVDYIRTQPSEATRLFQDLLIGVTAFFRENEAFQTLASEVIANLVEDKAADAPIRVWVPGCASGEEAYSVAMLLLEALGAAQKHNPLQVFATDIDEAALAVGRAGIYSENIGADVGAERLRRFFTREEGVYQVSKPLRECVTFAQQNVIADPPFSKLDLISCRNLLIYLEPDVQHKVVRLFHFALNDAGYLFLGNAETPGQQEGLFEPVSRKWRMYRRIGQSRPVAVDFPATGAKPRLPVGATPPAPDADRFGELTQRALLEDYAPAAVLVNRKQQILYFFGPTDAYLRHRAGTPTNDVLNLVRDDLVTKLRGALHKAAADQCPVTVPVVRVNREGTFARVKLTVKPVRVRPEDEALLLITFEDLPDAPPVSTEEPDELRQPLFQQLEYELKVTREDLQSHIEEQESTHEELQAANEEAMSVNEELQSTNEELETSKEELQSLNEELTTVNNQLKDKVEQLEVTTSDLTNLLSSTDIATLFLDDDRRIKRFTPASKSLFYLIATDVGRPLDDILQKFEDGDGLRDVEQVLDKLAPVEREVRTQAGEWFIRRVLPYRTSDNRIGGVVITFVEITERKRAEEQTRRLAAVVRDSNDAITVQDFDGRITAWNRGAKAMYGWTKREALSMNIAETIPEAKRGETLAHIDTLARGESVESFETQRLTKDGRTMDVWMTVTPLLDEVGQPVGVATTERDITERKTVEASLRQSEETFRSFLESAPDAMLMIDDTGAIQFANARTESLFGYPRDELLGTSVEQLIPERFRARHVTHRVEYFGAPTSRPMGSDLTLVCLTKEGQEIPIEVSLSPIETHAGMWVAAAIRDVTDRKRADDALREEKAFSDSLVDTAQAIVLLLDTEGRIVRVNPYFEQLTGCAADDVVGRDWFTTFLPQEDQAAIHALFKEVMRSGFNPGHTNPIVGKDGKRHHIEWRAKALEDARGEVVGLLNIGHDVTRRIVSERALEASKGEAEHANEAKSRFLAAASHDLRQPLQTISLLNEVLKRSIDDPKLVKVINGQHDALKAIQGLIDAYLDVSKLDAGVVRPAISTFAVQTLFARLHSEFSPHTQAAGLELRVAACGASIRSDPALLRQILENLIANAIRHTPAPGRVLIGARRRNDRMRLEVWDTGSGIPADQLDNIFEEFRQLDNPARAQQQGLGLGLAIARRLAQLLHHTIDVRSRPGKGSMFSVEVPIGESPPAAADTPARDVASLAPASSASLLLIDDDPSIVEALRLLLQGQGYEVSSATSGASALKQAEGSGESPVLVICDYRLPDNENGLDVIRKVRVAIGRDVPAILMTGDTAPARLRDADRHDCHVLHKPAKEGELLTLIQRLLG